MIGRENLDALYGSTVTNKPLLGHLICPRTHTALSSRWMTSLGHRNFTQTNQRRPGGLTAECTGPTEKPERWRTQFLAISDLRVRPSQIT